jgi:acid phosphatase family membrane protein YuiD
MAQSRTCPRARRSPQGRSATRLCLGILLVITAVPCLGGIDHLVPYDNAGIWKRNYQELLEYGLIAGEVVGGVVEGGESRFGRTLWQSIDASVSAGLIAQVLKVSFSRVRPRDSNGDPNLWFQGHGNESFPSGEVTAVSAIITPVVLEYASEHPAVYALELLPVYDGVARMKQQAHWQTDVLAGFALGTGMGWLMQRRAETPIILSVMPHAIYVGLRRSW